MVLLHRARVSLAISLCLWAIPTLWGGSPALAQDGSAQARLIQDESDLAYSTSFIWNCSSRTWDLLVANPLLLSALWKAYGYAPSYEVSAEKAVLHVVDSTGLEGWAELLSAGASGRSYLVNGRLNHWAVPFFNEGKAVFVLRSGTDAGQVRGELDVYIKADSKVAGAAIRVAAPLVRARVDNRVTLNLKDVQTIVEAIERQPQEVAARLDGPARAQFIGLFPH